MDLCTFTSAKYTKKCDDAINYAWSNEFGEIDQYNDLRAMILALKETQKNIITDVTYNMQCMRITLGFRISGLHAVMNFWKIGRIPSFRCYQLTKN
nr:serine carboxypeptidase 24 isoform X1 [Tanacetum cinerariifolium]